MGRAKEIIVKVIPSKLANAFIQEHHYSGKIVNNSTLHFGCFLDNRLHGVMSYGSPLDKRKILGLVEGTLWNEMLELNRMAFDEKLPRNSESRCIAMSFKLIRKNAPHIKWILSFSDATQCGDGIIYRASGFILTAIKKNANLCRLPNGDVIHKIALNSAPLQPRPELGGRTFYDLTGGRFSFDIYVNAVKGQILPGYQLRYVYLLDKCCKLTVPVIPFDEIEKVGARMYKGKKIGIRGGSIPANASGDQSEEEGQHYPTALDQ